MIFSRYKLGLLSIIFSSANGGITIPKENCRLVRIISSCTTLLVVMSGGIIVICQMKNRRRRITFERLFQGKGEGGLEKGL